MDYPYSQRTGQWFQCRSVTTAFPYYIDTRFAFSTIQMTTGAPINAVIALIGSTYVLPGSCAMISQKSISIAPLIITAGSKNPVVMRLDHQLG